VTDIVRFYCVSCRICVFCFFADDKIPAKATLVYDVKLLEIDSGHRPTNFFGEIDTDGDSLLSQDEVLAVVLVDFCTCVNLMILSAF